MATTIAVSEQTRKRLMRLKLEEGSKSMDELMQTLLTEYRMAKYRDASKLLREKMAEKGLTLEDLVGKDRVE